MLVVDMLLFLLLLMRHHCVWMCVCEPFFFVVVLDAFFPPTKSCFCFLCVCVCVCEGTKQPTKAATTQRRQQHNETIGTTEATRQYDIERYINKALCVRKVSITEMMMIYGGWMDDETNCHGRERKYTVRHR